MHAEKTTTEVQNLPPTGVAGTTGSLTNPADKKNGGQRDGR